MSTDQDVFAPVSRLQCLAAELKVARLGPRPDFRLALRESLLAEADRRPVVPDSVAGGRQTRSSSRRLAAAGVAALVVASATSAAAAVWHSLPGDPLHRIRNTIADALDGSDRAGTRDSAHSLQRHVGEAVRLAGAAGTDPARWTAFDRTMATIGTDAADLRAAPGTPATRTAYGAARSRLVQLLSTVPVLHQPAVRDALARFAPTVDGPAVVPVFGLLAPVELVNDPALASGWPVFGLPPVALTGGAPGVPTGFPSAGPVAPGAGAGPVNGTARATGTAPPSTGAPTPTGSRPAAGATGRGAAGAGAATGSPTGTGASGGTASAGPDSDGRSTVPTTPSARVAPARTGDAQASTAGPGFSQIATDSVAGLGLPLPFPARRPG